jgi:hypothetical protein
VRTAPAPLPERRSTVSHGAEAGMSAYPVSST